MLRQQWPDTVLAGNLRASALEALPQITARTPVALELSSFQLEWLGAARISPPFALVTNLSPDHLNRHGTMEAYADAKAQVFRWQHPGDVVVLNGDDPNSHEFFGTPPGAIWFNSADPPPFAPQDLRLPGAHNQANAVAAATLARAFGASDASIGAALRGFGSVPDRLELLAEVGGVRYINDTTATNPAAAVAALAAVPGPIVLLAGGADKGLEFAELGQRIAARAKVLVLLQGNATPRLEQAVRVAGSVPILGPFGNLEEAVAAARSAATVGDAILLSPACASFGMFRNEFHRGDVFRRIVHALAAQE
jgi:UDP-N-acetylmuramoylalanine--D-glutamate ligase